MTKQGQILNCGLSEDVIEKLGDYIIENFRNESNDYSKIACVFGGKRPALFLRKYLAQKIKKTFYPPKIYSIDEFVEYVIDKNSSISKIGELETAYLIYKIVKQRAPSILRNRKSFPEFLPWAREISSFIEQVDLEDIENGKLLNIEKSAEIGYDVPDNINKLLKHIVNIRKAYHDALIEQNIFSRGTIYLEASKKIKKSKFDEFDGIILCNFFYLHRTELNIIKEIYEKHSGVCLFQGLSSDWSVLEKNVKAMNITIGQPTSDSKEPHLCLYQGFDMHSQVCLVREIVKKIPDKNNTVILLPRSESLIPLLTEISSSLDEFNVSMGYQLKRSSLYVLFNSLFRAQESKKDGKYYARDYLEVMRHPLVKNLAIDDDSAITRVMIHKIEELTRGDEKSMIGGSLFLSLTDIEAENKIYTASADTLKNMGIIVDPLKCKEILSIIHELFFKSWETADSFKRFSINLGTLLNVISAKSMIHQFAFNLKVIDKLKLTQEEIGNLSFNTEKLKPIEIWEIFQQKLDSEMISFSGSPLRGLQILGLFETRSLRFENVIVMDLNESILPKLKIHEPLIPREVMLNLGLNRLEKEEEIQRYQFNCLIQGARNVHLVYEDNQEKEKSRFIEELLWKMQKKERVLDVVNVPRATFSIGISANDSLLRKTTDIIEFLKSQKYSASRINCYLGCPAQFYYQYVLGLKEQDDLLDEPQAPHIGTFIHQLLENTFSVFRGKTPVIDINFKKYFNKMMNEKFKEELEPRMKSDSFLLKRIIEKRLSQFLDKEIERNVKKIICLEEKKEGVIKFNNYSVNFVYTVDRIDQFQDESISVIDYKTGGADIAPKRFKALSSMELDIESIREDVKSFQLPLYYHFVSKEFQGCQVNAELYNLRNLERKAFIAEEDLKHKDNIMRICIDALEVVLNEIFNPDISFIPNREERRCEFCSFRALCK